MSMPADVKNALTFTKTVHHDTYAAINPAKHDHAGKFILVTGASKGIGRAIAIAYAQAGASGIAIAARSGEGLQATEDAIRAVVGNKTQILRLELDVADPTSNTAAVEQFLKVFSKLDILVNNAGYMESPIPLAHSDAEEWWKPWEVNVRGTYLVVKAFLPILLNGGDKTIVNISTAGAVFPVPYFSAYTSSKFGLLKLGETLLLENGDRGLLVFAVHPGTVATDMAAKLPQEMVVMVPVFDAVELVAHTLTWLTGTKREWLNGRYLGSNWDVEELEAEKEDILGRDLLKLKLAI